MTLRFNIHAAAERATWHAKATTFSGVTTLAIVIGADEVVVFVRPDQARAARDVADAINAAFGADAATGASQGRPDHPRRPG